MIYVLSCNMNIFFQEFRGKYIILTCKECIYFSGGTILQSFKFHEIDSVIYTSKISKSN